MLQNAYDIADLTLGMLLHYLEKLKIHIFADIQQIWKKMDKILIKSLHLKGYPAKRLTDKFPEKSWTKCAVKKQLKKLRDTGTVDRRQAAADLAVPSLKKMLRS